MTQGRHKRYIAGAECPECGVMDKIYVIMSDDGTPESRHCNRCGYEQRQSDADNGGNAVKEEWQTVRITPPHEDP